MHISNEMIKLTEQKKKKELNRKILRKKKKIKTRNLEWTKKILFMFNMHAYKFLLQNFIIKSIQGRWKKTKANIFRRYVQLGGWWWWWCTKTEHIRVEKQEKIFKKTNQFSIWYEYDDVHCEIQSHHHTNFQNALTGRFPLANRKKEKLNVEKEKMEIEENNIKTI